MARKTAKELYDESVAKINKEYDSEIDDVKSDKMADESRISSKVSELEAKRKSELEKAKAKFDKDSEPSDLEKAVKAVKDRTLGRDAAKEIGKVAEAAGGDGEIVEKRTMDAVDRAEEATHAYDTDTMKATTKGGVERAAKKATIINADADYDTYATWNDYYNYLKRQGLSDEQIKTKLKGSKWEKEGSAYLKWKNGETEEKPTETPKEEVKPTVTETTKTTATATAPTTSTPHDEETTKEIEKSDEETSKITASNKKAQDLLNRKVQLSDYLNSGYPTTAGLIFSPKSGLKWYERLGMGLKVIGKITGDVLLANGASLLGDNSYFAKIGEGLDADSMTSENQKEFAKKLNDSSIETAKQVVQNRDLINKLYSQQGIDNLDSKKLDFLAYFTTTVASMPQEDAIAELKRNGFTDDEAEVAYQNSLMASKTTGSAQTLTQGAVATESSKLNLFDQEFKTEKELNDAINELQKRKLELQKEAKEISTMNFDAVIKFAKDNRDLMQGIATMAANENTSSAEGKTSNSNWNAAASANIDIPVADIGVSVSGSHSWGDTLNTSTAKGLSQTMDALALGGIKTGEGKAKEWWSKHGAKLQSAMKAGVDAAIADIDKQIADYRAKVGTIGKSDERLKDIVTLDFENEEEKAMWMWLTGLDKFEYGERNHDKILSLLD